MADDCEHVLHCQNIKYVSHRETIKKKYWGLHEVSNEVMGVEGNVMQYWVIVRDSLVYVLKTHT